MSLLPSFLILDYPLATKFKQWGFRDPCYWHKTSEKSPLTLQWSSWNEQQRGVDLPFLQQTLEWCEAYWEVYTSITKYGGKDSMTWSVSLWSSGNLFLLQQPGLSSPYKAKTLALREIIKYKETQ